MPEFSGIHHLNFTVTDLERSAAWYRQVMGLNDGWEMEDTGGRGRKYVLLHPTSPLRIVLTRHQSNSNQPFSEYITGLDHIAFTVADRPALKAWCEHFDSLGVDRSEIKEGATGWLVTFRDPDNLQLEMYTAVK